MPDRPNRRSFFGILLSCLGICQIPKTKADISDNIPKQLTDPDISKFKRGCLLAGPGRGDCEHFLGIPEKEIYPDTVDEYGRPHGWCEICWRDIQFKRLQKSYYDDCVAYGGESYARIRIKRALSPGENHNII